MTTIGHVTSLRLQNKINSVQDNNEQLLKSTEHISHTCIVYQSNSIYALTFHVYINMNCMS